VRPSPLFSLGSSLSFSFLSAEAIALPFLSSPSGCSLDFGSSSPHLSSLLEPLPDFSCSSLFLTSSYEVVINSF